MQPVFNSNDMALHIFSFLPRQDLMIIPSICNIWKSHSEEDTFWEYLCYASWGNSDIAKGNGSWKERFKLIRNWELGEFTGEKIKDKRKIFHDDKKRYFFVSQRDPETNKLALINVLTGEKKVLNHPFVQNFMDVNDFFAFLWIQGSYLIFDIQSGKLKGSIAQPDGFSNHVSNNKYLVLEDRGKLKVWDLESMNELPELNIQQMLKNTDLSIVDKLQSEWIAGLGSNEWSHLENTIDRPITLKQLTLSNKYPFKLYDIIDHFVILRSRTAQMPYAIDLRQRKLIPLRSFNGSITTSDEKILSIRENFKDGVLKLSVDSWVKENLERQPDTLSMSLPSKYNFFKLFRSNHWLNDFHSDQLIWKNFLVCSHTGASYFGGPPQTYIYIWNLKTKKLMSEFAIKEEITSLISMDEEKIVAMSVDNSLIRDEEGRFVWIGNNSLITFNFNGLQLKQADEKNVAKMPISKGTYPIPLIKRIAQSVYIVFRYLSVQFSLFYAKIAYLLSRTIVAISEVARSMRVQV